MSIFFSSYFREEKIIHVIFCSRTNLISYTLKREGFQFGLLMSPGYRLLSSYTWSIKPMSQMVESSFLNTTQDMSRARVSKKQANCHTFVYLDDYNKFIVRTFNSTILFISHI